MGHISDYDRPKKASCVRVRYLIALMATLCPVVCYISRQNLSMAIVAMVHEVDTLAPPVAEPPLANLSLATTGGSAPQTPLPLGEPAPGTSPRPDMGAPHASCPKPLDADHKQAASDTSHGPKYHWSLNEQSLVLGAFFWTYVIFQIPAARLAEQLGAKWILATATVGSALLSVLAPAAASKSVYALFAIRALMGLCQTALYPACYVLYSHWLPPLERSQALPILCVGAYLGSIIASTSTGFFMQQASLGWEWAFYMPGLLCAIWSVFWVWLGASEPRESVHISLEELDYIEARLEARGRPVGGGGAGGGGTDPNGSTSSLAKEQQQRKQISWLRLFSSQHIWALNATMFASNWSFSIVLLLLPTYLNDVLHVEPLKNGMINSTIYILYCVASPVVGSISTLMVETRALGLSRLNIRKLFQCVALFGQAACFAAIPLIGCDTSLVMTVLFVQIVLFSFINGGEVQLPSELSADFSGTIYAVANCIGSSTGFLVPAVRSLIVDDPRNRFQWNSYFYVAAALSSAGALVFLVFGKNDLQDFSASGNQLADSTLFIYKSSSSAKKNQFNLEAGGGALTRQQQLPPLGSWRPRRDSLDATSGSCNVNNSDNRAALGEAKF